MKKLLYFAFAAMLCCGFTACSDDDNGGVGNADNLIGRWTLVKEVWEEAGEHGVDVEEPGEWVICFKEDGTGYDQENYGGQSWTYYFAYEISGNQLIFYYEDGDVGSVKISSLTANQLVFYEEGRDEDGYYKYEEYFTRY